MLTIRQVAATNGTDTRELEVFADADRLWLWDRTNDPRCESALEIADQSDTAIMDAIRDSGYALLSACTAELDSPAATIRVVLWHGTRQETHLVDSYAAAMDLVNERHHNWHEPAFYDAATGERLYDDNGYGLATESGEIRFA